jgi:uncharacterized delta-60 repeat protein
MDIRKKKLQVMRIVLSLISYSSLYPIQPGDLDPSFGGTPAPGLMITDFFGSADNILGIVLQPDGKIVAAGSAAGGPGGTNFALARYKPDGSLDPDFGGNPTPGLQVTDFFGGIDIANAVVLQVDGKIVAVGQAAGGPGGANFVLARYMPDGSLDPDFGGNPAPGLQVTDFFGSTDIARGAVLQPDGKIIAVGQAAGGTGGTNFALARYKTDGSLDGTFGGNPMPGLMVTDFFAGTDIARGVALQPDGKIVVVGSVTGGTGGTNFALARYMPDGSLDPDFGGNPAPGLMVTDFFGSTDQANAVVLQPDGKIVVVGQAAGGTGGTNFALARYTTNGSLDETFGGTPAPGLQVTDFFGSTDIAHAVALQPDGKIVAVGEAASGPGGIAFALARYKTDGSLDEAFGGTPAPGLMITDFFAGNLIDIANGVVVQSDGKIVAAGQAGGSGFGFDFGLARYFAFNPGRVSPLTQAIIDKYC